MKNKTVNGFKNHYWNGVTTDAWINWVYRNIIFDLKVSESIVHIGASDWVSKSYLLHTMNKIFDLNLTIQDIFTEDCSDRRLTPDFVLTDVYEMLCDMREFWYE